jgi:uncharacterized HAD superfamily protein
MKPKVLLDLDGTVANFYTGFATYLNDNYGTTLGFNDEPSGYNFEDWGGGVEALNIKEATAAWIQDGGYAYMELYPGAAEFVATLKDLFDVWVVTARSGEASRFTPKLDAKIKADTKKWVKDNLGLDRVLFSFNKPTLCVNNGIQVMLEDKLSTAIEGAKEGVKTVLIDRSWNSSPPRLNIYRATNYDEALKYLRKLQGV